MRRKVEVGYSRGEETRARILNAALNLFGAKGYDSVSTREIADAAAVPAPSLQYYFGAKRDLYIACLEHVQALSFQSVEPALLAAEKLLQNEDVDPERLIDAYCAVQEALVDRMIGSDDGTMALFIVRHDLPSVMGAHQLAGDNVHSLRMMACCTKLVLRISGNRLDPQTALLIAGLTNGQLSIMYLRRERLAQAGWTLNAERLGWLKQTIREHTTAMLRVHCTAPLVIV